MDITRGNPVQIQRRWVAAPPLAEQEFLFLWKIQGGKGSSHRSLLHSELYGHLKLEKKGGRWEIAAFS